MFYLIWMYLYTAILIIRTSALENLALNKPAEMSTQRSADSGADSAVDGNIVQMDDNTTCALTDLDHAPEAWWRVDLNGTFAVTELKLYLLNREIYRFRFYSIHFTDEITNWRSSPYCARDYQDVDGPSSSVVTLNCDGKGRYLTIWLNRQPGCYPTDNINLCDILQLCEVQVLGCYPGKYSQNCNMTCSVNCRDDICSIDDGRCYECKDGYLGDRYDTECTQGRFGRQCSQVCNGNCRDGRSCSNINGSCPGGCMDGYKGLYCNETCLHGQFGLNCIQKCGHCSGNNTCLHTDGSCPNGCDIGWKGTNCDTGCDVHTYGHNCSRNCSRHCRDHVTCNLRNGVSDKGCEKGWKGLYCNETCRQGTYGYNCDMDCSGNCRKNASCNTIDGSCNAGCKEGWKGTVCNEACRSGTYGLSCKETCGQCSQDRLCNQYSGYCPHGCIDGWIGKTCKTKCEWGRFGLNCSHACDMCEVGCHHVSGDCLYKDVPNLTPLVVTVCILCVIIVILVVILVIHCRRNHGCTLQSEEGTPNPGTSQDIQTSNSDNTNMTYEELQTRDADRRVYDSLNDTHVAYQNTVT